MAHNTERMPNGAAAAAIVAAGFGCFATGLMTTGAEISAGLKSALTLSQSVGPLSGKTMVGVIAWLVAWAAMHFLWKGKAVDFHRVYVIALVLVGLGFLFTFPLFFAVFAKE